MIGQVRFTVDGQPATVTLEDDQSVTSTHPELGELLRALVEEHQRNYSPAHGLPGIAALEELASLSAGQLELPEPDADSADSSDSTDRLPVY